jgi:hypothetical protein
MNKKNLSVVLSALLVLGTTSAFASMNIPLGHGTVDGTANQVAVLSLDGLNSRYIYDISCTVNDPTADKMPAKVRVSIDGLANSDYFFTFDDKPNSTHQALLSDINKHTFGVFGVQPYGMMDNKVSVNVTWLAGEDITTPVTYDCSATPSVGK